MKVYLELELELGLLLFERLEITLLLFEILLDLLFGVAIPIVLFLIRFVVLGAF